MRKDAIVQARCTFDEKRKIEQKALKAGLKSSEYMVKCSLNSRTRISSASKDMARTFTQLQSILNELRTNAEKQNSELSTDPQIFVKICDEAQERMDELWRLLK